VTDPKVIRPHPDGWLDHVRTAIFALQLASELTSDEAEIEHLHEVIKKLQKGLAAHARRRDVSPFAEPELPHVDRLKAKPEAESKA
jgi:hypothetical protein